MKEAFDAQTAAPLVSNDVKTPDIPPHLVKCIEKEPPHAPTADGKVKNLKLTADERKECGKAILAWYKQIQAANKKQAAAKPKT